MKNLLTVRVSEEPGYALLGFGIIGGLIWFAKHSFLPRSKGAKVVVRKQSIPSGSASTAPPESASTAPGTSSAPTSPAVWREETGEGIILDPARVYVATINVAWPESISANTDAVSKKLREAAQWNALDVYSQVKDLPSNWPGPKPKDDSDRYWAVGVPASQQAFKRPKVISLVFSRPR